MAGARPSGPLPASQRVRKRSEFRRIQTGGERVVLPHFVLLLDANPAPDATARLGITASRKIGNAVVRNRAKRLVREAFRSTRDLWPLGLDLVVIVRRFDQTLKLDDVVNEWRSAHVLIRRRCDQRFSSGSRVAAKADAPQDRSRAGAVAPRRPSDNRPSAWHREQRKSTRGGSCSSGEHQ